MSDFWRLQNFFEAGWLIKTAEEHSYFRQFHFYVAQLCIPKQIPTDGIEDGRRPLHSG